MLFDKSPKQLSIQNVNALHSLIFSAENRLHVHIHKSWCLAAVQNGMGELLQRFREHSKNALPECLRNFEEGKSLDYISYRFEHTLLTVMQMEFVGDGPNEFIVALPTPVIVGSS